MTDHSRTSISRGKSAITITEIMISMGIFAVIALVTMTVLRSISLNVAHFSSEAVIEQNLTTVVTRLDRELRSALAATVSFDGPTNDTPVAYLKVSFRRVVGITNNGRPILGPVISYHSTSNGEFIRSENGQPIVIGSYAATGNTAVDAGLVFQPLNDRHITVEFTARVRAKASVSGDVLVREQRRLRITLENRGDDSSGS